MKHSGRLAGEMRQATAAGHLEASWPIPAESGASQHFPAPPSASQSGPAYPRCEFSRPATQTTSGRLSVLAALCPLGCRCLAYLIWGSLLARFSECAEFMQERHRSKRDQGFCV